MSLRAKLKAGRGPVWGPLNRIARWVLAFHLPVNRGTRPVFRVLYRVHVGVREGWIWARRFFWTEPLFRSQCAAVGGGFRMEDLPYITGAGRIRLGSDVRLSGRSSITFPPTAGSSPELVVGDCTFIGHACGFTAASSIRIGRHCLLASGVLVYDQDGHPLDADRRRAGEPTPADQIRPVVIGDDVWVGHGALILKGVRVGDRAVIAARSVVTKDVPADAVVAGNPARVVRWAEGSAPGEPGRDGRFQPAAGQAALNGKG